MPYDYLLVYNSGGRYEEAYKLKTDYPMTPLHFSALGVKTAYHQIYSVANSMSDDIIDFPEKKFLVYISEIPFRFELPFEGSNSEFESIIAPLFEEDITFL
jgi:hypothetical protein